MKFATKSFDNTRLTLDILLHYLGKLKIQIVCKYSVVSEFKSDIQHMEENANKLHFRCTDFNSSTHVTVYAKCI